MNKDLKAIILPLILLFASSLVFLYGCAGGQELHIKGMEKEAKRDAKAKKMNDLMLESAMAHNSRPDADYVIGPEDLLDIDVFQVEELRRTVRVSAQGYIGLPLIGAIKAKGLTATELEKEITKKLEKYLEEPIVSVYIKEYRSQRIAVLGAVKSPQVYAITGQKYLLDMLSKAGGLTDDAGSICYVIRPSDSSAANAPTAKTIVIDLDELLVKGNTLLNIPVFSGDVINVPKGGVVFVDGAVESPGAFPLHGRMTVVQAITMAKGLKYVAAKSDIRIYRDNGNPERDIIPVDYPAIVDGKSPDIPVKDNDIIIVPTNGIKNFFSGFLRTIRGAISFGGASVGL